MEKIKNLTREVIITAIRRIEQNPSLRIGRESKEYDLIFENQSYPPILVLSEANKIMGGDELTHTDFNNNVQQAFVILRKFDFQIQPKSGMISKNESLKVDFEVEQNHFDYRKFHFECEKANLHFNPKLILRYCASLLSKRFLILTGLSGSGKTQLALNFARWLTSGSSINSDLSLFVPGEVIEAERVSYQVVAADTVAVTLIQPETSIKTSLPFALIEEWVNAIINNKFPPTTPARTIREEVAKTTQYSSQLNSFETHLKSLSFHLLNRRKRNEKKLKQICMVPVGADWTNREPLLGYPNALEKEDYKADDFGVLQLIIEANMNPDKPYFLILDEMNLSHVERYFADFLSVMESKTKLSLHSGDKAWNGIPSTIGFPQNLFIVGTVNIDETTYMFSPKVLDRANVIEFRVSQSEMEQYLNGHSKIDFENLAGSGAGMAGSFVDMAKDDSLATSSLDEIKQALLDFFSALKKAGAEFGYRSASEILRFVAVINKIEPSWKTDEIMDAAIMQKLLPKVHGSRRKLEPVFKTLGNLCLVGNETFETLLANKSSIDFTDKDKIKYPISLEKILRMYDNLLSNGFTSYAEA